MFAAIRVLDHVLRQRCRATARLRSEKQSWQALGLSSLLQCCWSRVAGSALSCFTSPTSGRSTKDLVAGHTWTAGYTTALLVAGQTARWALAAYTQSGKARCGPAWSGRYLLWLHRVDHLDEELSLCVELGDRHTPIHDEQAVGGEVGADVRNHAHVLCRYYL